MEGPFSLADGHEQIVYGNDPDSGLRCIVSIYSTALGPGLGGTRFFPYPTEEEALVDVLRLSRAMAYKAASAGLDLGGGKAVIIGDPATDKTESLLRAYGRVVDSLGGRYVTACDIGTYPADMSVVRRETRWATGALEVDGSSGDSGVMTAFGTYIGVKASVARAFGNDSLAGRHVAIQGVGKVGKRLAEHIQAEGAKLTVSDVSEAAADWCAEHLDADVAAPEEIHTVDADVFSPNALGGGLNDDTIPQLNCRIVAGAANNQLLGPEHGDMLADRRILYAPDYVINAGGLMQVADELHPHGYSVERARARTTGIADRLHDIFDIADEQQIPTSRAAAVLAERRMAGVGRLRRFWLPSR